MRVRSSKFEVFRLTDLARASGRPVGDPLMTTRLVALALNSGLVEVPTNRYSVFDAAEDPPGCLNGRTYY